MIGVGAVAAPGFERRGKREGDRTSINVEVLEIILSSKESTVCTSPHAPNPKSPCGETSVGAIQQTGAALVHNYPPFFFLEVSIH